MELKITCRNCKHTPDLDNHILEQIKKIEDFLKKERQPQILDITIDMHKTHQYNLVTANLQAADHIYFAQHEGADLFAEINEVLDRLYAQLRDFKEKRVDGKKGRCDGECRAKFYAEMEEMENEMKDIEEVEQVEEELEKDLGKKKK